MPVSSSVLRNGLCAAMLTVLHAQEVSLVSVNWTSVQRPLTSVVGFQTVVNPVTTRESPYHDAVYDKIAALGAPFQRYVPWLPYPRLGIAELEQPSHGGLCGFVNSGGAGNIWSTTLDCAAQGAGVIDGVTFANYGLPTGFCNDLKPSPSCSRDVSAIVAAACVGKPSCTLLSNDEVFGAAPCAGSRLAIEVTCSVKSVTTFTYWNFDLLDEGMIDFLTAANASGRTAIPNFSTIPNWMFSGNGDRSYFPDDPLGETWNYEQGSTLRDPTGKEIGDYYGRLLAHYVEGGFVDEGGRFVPGLNLSFSHWEVLNEVNYEHGLSPQYYTQIYDWIVAGIKRWAPRGTASLKFVGLAVNELASTMDYATYFLNSSNHAPGIPVDAFSFHHYAGSATRDGGANCSDYEAFFTSADSWIASVQAIQAVRAASSYPNALMDADEVGVILPDDNDAQWTSTAPGFPALYWNAAAAMFAYEFGLSASIGLDVLGESQLIGYPSIPFSRGPPINGPWTAPPQYPSVSILSWGGAFGNQGDGTARYWMLKLLVDNFRATGTAGTFPLAEADVLVNTSVSNKGSTNGSSPFCASVLNLDVMNIACFDDGATISGISFADYGTPTGSCGSWAVNASCSTANSLAIVEGFCLGTHSCSVPANTPTFGDPCYGTVKELVVQATCSSGGGGQVTASGVFAQAFVENAGDGERKVLVVNKGSSAASVTLAGAAGGAWTYVDESTAYGPAVTTTLTSDTWLLAPYALGILRLSA